MTALWAILVASVVMGCVLLVRAVIQARNGTLDPRTELGLAGWTTGLAAVLALVTSNLDRRGVLLIIDAGLVAAGFVLFVQMKRRPQDFREQSRYRWISFGSMATGLLGLVFVAVLYAAGQ
jgi:hypothetical protein